jgi:hypothetical protein
MDDIRRQIETQALIEQVKDIESGATDEPITNTSGRPASVLLDAMNHAERTGSPDGFIEGMEAAGQRELVKSEGARLPVEGTINDRWSRDDKPSTREILEGWGFKLGEPVEGDDIWIHAELPEGWKLLPTDHSMWSEIRDDKGRKRCGLFYKAAFYDRSCHLTLDRRFGRTTEDVDKSGDFWGSRIGIVTDCGQEIERFGPFENPCTTKEEYYKLKDNERAITRAENATKDWLNKNYPDWESVTAYWD